VRHQRQGGQSRGQIQPGGNPFEGPRSSEYPNPPMAQTYAPTLFGKAAAELGRHPFPHPTGNLSRAYTNPLGVRSSAPAPTAASARSLAAATTPRPARRPPSCRYLMTEAELHAATECEVLRDRARRRRQARDRRHLRQQRGRGILPAGEMVILCAYILQNVRLLLLSGIGKPYDPKTAKAWSARTTPTRPCRR
jgi:gluconate 2-dehydrogenase alpha chain